MGGDEYTQISMADKLHDDIINNNVPPMIMVFPNGGSQSFYIDDYTEGLQVESYIVLEFIPHIDQTYRTIASRTGRGTTGFSMGGWGSIKFALKYPDIFCSCVPICPVNAFDGPPPENDMSQFVATYGPAAKGLVSLRIIGGADDPFSLSVLQTTDTALTQLNYSHIYISVPNLVPVPGYFENKDWRLISNIIWIGLLLFGFIVLRTFGTMLFDHYTSDRNMNYILAQFLYLVLPAITVSVIYSNGSIDLSVGAVASLTAVLTTLSVNNGMDVSSAIFNSMIIALIIGCINGTFSGIFRTPGTIFTFIVAFFLRSIVLSLFEGRTIPINQDISGVATVGWVLFILLTAGAILWIQFPGYNIEIAKQKLEKNKRLSLGIINIGIPYVVSALSAAVAGLCFLNHIKAATSKGLTNFEIDIILVLILSGSCLYSGFGNVVGVILAALILTSLKNLMLIMNINIFMQNIIIAGMMLSSLLYNYGFHAIVGLIYRHSVKKNNTSDIT